MGLPKKCKGGKLEQCYKCLWYRGAIAHFCPKNGGDAEFEPSGGEPPRIETFQEYTLENGPLHKLNKGEFDPDGKLRIRSKEQEKKILKKLGCHKMERGEICMGIRAELKDPPKRRIYSYTKGE